MFCRRRARSWWRNEDKTQFLKSELLARRSRDGNKVSVVRWRTKSAAPDLRGQKMENERRRKGDVGQDSAQLKGLNA